MSDEQPKSAEEIVAEVRARREAAEEALAKAIAKKRAEDFTAAAELLADPANSFIEPDVTSPTLPTLVVFRRPSKPEASRYRTMSNQDKADARLNARIDLARQILMWPDAAAYELLVAEHAFVPDKIAVAAIKLAEGEAKREVKT